MDKHNSFIDNLGDGVRKVASLFDRIGFVWLFLILSVLLMVPVYFENPAKVGSYLWFVSKLCCAAALGFGVDKAFFRGSDPRFMSEGIEKAMAQQRRSVIIASCLIGAGLIG